jgi:hypothetical protein
MRFHYLLLFFLLSLSPTLLAQDTHYWTQQFGTRSALMGGAVVAEATDNSAVYYNPGGLGFIDETTISINANLYRIENVRIENALGQAADFRSSSFNSVPILVGGMFRIKNPQWRVGYGLLAPVDFSFKGNARIDGQFGIVNDAESPGSELLVGESEKSSTLTEVTAAIGVGRKLNDYWSVGLTNLFTLRSLSYQRQLLVHVILNDPSETLMNTTFLQYAKYFHTRYAAKLGINYRGARWSAGFTVTTPSVGLLGNGTLASDITAQNLKLNQPERFSGFANDRQEKLKTQFSAPFSTSAGVQYRFNRSLLALSVEYFGSVDPYAIIRAEPAVFVRYGSLGNNLGSEEVLTILGGAKPVLNAALGYERSLTEFLTLNLSFRNNMSYLDSSLKDELGYKTSISSWDIYHATGGVTIDRSRSSMSIGLLLSSGSNSRHQENGSLSNPSEDNLLQGIVNITSANYTSIGFLLGYTFNFNKYQ